jgi:hypothetical protein
MPLEIGSNETAGLAAISLLTGISHRPIPGEQGTHERDRDR